MDIPFKTNGIYALKLGEDDISYTGLVNNFNNFIFGKKTTFWVLRFRLDYNSNDSRKYTVGMSTI